MKKIFSGKGQSKMNNIARRPYLFSARTTLAANADGQINFQIDSSYDYMMTSWTYKSTSLFEVQMFDNEQKIFYDYISNEVFNGWYAAMIANGDRHWNRFDPAGYLFKAKANINIALRDISGAQNTVKIFLNGYRIYTY